MAKIGKKFKAAFEKVDRTIFYDPKEALKLAKELSFTKFDGTVEMHLRTGLDPRQADQQVRDVVVLPHGLGKTVRVLVFAQGEGADKRRQPFVFDLFHQHAGLLNRRVGCTTHPTSCQTVYMNIHVNSSIMTLCAPTHRRPFSR